MDIDLSWACIANSLRTGEKQKEHKERTERDDRNQENAGGSYRVPDANDLGPGDEELSGLPWGGINSKDEIPWSSMRVNMKSETNQGAFSDARRRPGPRKRDPAWQRQGQPHT